MKLELEVKNEDKMAEGTVGFILENASYILIRTDSKDKNQKAWLMDKQDQPMSILCFRNWNGTAGDPGGRITTLSSNHVGYKDGYLRTDKRFSEKGLMLLIRIAQIAKKEMEKANRENEKVTVVIIKSGDREAKNLAKAAAEDPKVVPILKDRLSEVLP